MDTGLRWDESYSVGVEAFDADHKQLLSLGNAVIEATSNAGAEAAVRTMLDALHAESTRHFALEEALMRQAGYPLLQEHQDAHARLAAELGLFIAQYETGHLGPGRLARFLLRWIVQHIVTEDRKFQIYCEAAHITVHAMPSTGAPAGETVGAD